MRKYKIESRRWVGCIKNLDITAPGDTFRAVGVSEHAAYRHGSRR
jgi:hypothetical protein